jgi:hypothetical protein
MRLRRSAVFFGVARNCADHLPGVLANLERFSALYEAVSFMFVVSDTVDDTCSILERWLASGRRGKVVDLGALQGRLPARTERIAHARNAGLDEIGRNWPSHDHLVVADLDDVLATPVALDDFARCAAWLDSEPRRAGVFANATPCYYDIWALRHDRWCPEDCWQPIWGRPAAESFESAKLREVFARQIDIPPWLAPVPVRSAFGGLAIYRMTFASTARYCGSDAQGRETSEHVAFNAAIGRAGGELHIFPALQVQAPRQHLYQPSHCGLRWRIAMQALRACQVARPPWRQFLVGA